MPVLSWDDDEGWEKLANDLTADLVQKLEAREARRALLAQQSGQPDPSDPVNASSSLSVMEDIPDNLPSA